MVVDVRGSGVVGLAAASCFVQVLPVDSLEPLAQGFPTTSYPPRLSGRPGAVQVERPDAFRPPGRKVRCHRASCR